MLDLIDRVGPGGHFIGTRETAERCREEIWVPTLMSREPWESWTAAGCQTMVDRVKGRVRSILATHEPPALPPGAPGRIEAILQAAEKRHERAARGVGDTL